MIKKGLIIGIVNLIIGILLNFGVHSLFPTLGAEYQNPAIFRPWQDPLMMAFFAYPFIFGFIAVYFWNMIGRNFTGSETQKAFQFAKLYFIIATIPGMFATYTSFQVSFLMILNWAIVGFIDAYIAGYILAKLK